MIFIFKKNKVMNIDIKILEIFKISKDLGKNKIQIQNLDHLLGRKGEREYIGNALMIKLKELLKSQLIVNENTFYSITPKGLDYLEKNSST
ncbi:hypothetical protein BEI02_09685 [Elizabethkingia sp. HvH-WGS333]|nr:hypothetical protein BEI02_09685 [Elizabethkingia sp. HvH-WGS333]